MKKILFKIKYWLDWHGYFGKVTMLSTFVEHFNLSKDEEEMLNKCVSLHLLKESVCLSEDKSKACIVVSIRDCIRLLKLRRKNMENYL